MNHRGTIAVAVGALCVCSLIGLGLRNRTTDGQSSGPLQTAVVSVEEGQSRAFEQIRQRAQWPESPEAVTQAFWDARAARDYAEMEVLWPGSASFDWPETCRNDPNVTYVFGPAGNDGETVPYAAKDHFDATGIYNLTMRLGLLQTAKGPRYYIISGN